jgi:hypothetical protein
MNKLLSVGIAILMFVGVVGIVNAQTATPTATPTPTTTVPGGAPSTGFGR